MVEKPQVSAFQNFFWIKNPLNINKVMDRNVFCIYGVNINRIGCITNLKTCVNSVDIHRIWWYGWKALSFSFLKLFPDWKFVGYGQMSIMGKNVCMCFISTVLTYITFNAPCTLIPCIDCVDMRMKKPLHPLFYIHTMHCLLESFVSTISEWEWSSQCMLLCTHNR